MLKFLKSYTSLTRSSKLYMPNAPGRFFETGAKLNEQTNDNLPIKEKILKASLAYVPTHGWSKDSLAAGANECGYPGVASGLFVNGGADLVHHFMASSNDELEVEVQSFISNSEKINDKIIIRAAIEIKLQKIIPYINKWPQAMTLMLLPQHCPEALRNHRNMVDIIGFYANYKELNTLWYLRRLGISSLYKSTELYLLQDKSQCNESTWKFLERSLTRMDVLTDSMDQFQDADKIVTGVFTTVQNMIGLNHP